MIRAFWEVLQDLWNFILTSLKINNTYKSSLKDQATPTNNFEEKDKPNGSLAGIVVPSVITGQERVAYVQVDEVSCFLHSEPGLGSKIGTLTYGEKITITRVDGLYAEVNSRLLHGWVETKALSDDPNQVFPSLQSAQVYSYDRTQTKKIRQFIQNETPGQHTKLSLQSKEYVLYVLKRAGVQVSWPLIGAHEPGEWHNALQDVKGISIGAEPRTAAIMEYGGNEKPGFLGYVEAVHPDQSITLQSVGRVKSGEYGVEEFTREEWKKWCPVFISFT